MKQNKKMRQMVQLAVLTAILLVMAFTPLGYLKLGPLSITFLTLPVAVASVVMGPQAGLIMGAVFGLTSFFQCFGMDEFGVTLLSISFWKTMVMCLVPRLLAGGIPGLIYRGLKNKNRTLGTALTCLATPLINTLFFMGLLVLFFRNEPYLQGFGDSVWAILTALGVGNAIPEALVTLVAGTAICAALQKIWND